MREVKSKILLAVLSMFLMLVIPTLPLNAESFEKVETVNPPYVVSSGSPVQNVTYRLLAVEQYFADQSGNDIPMKSAQWLIMNLTRYKNWQNVTWGDSKYTSYIHLLSYASLDSSVSQFYRGAPTNSNVVNEITNFLGQTGPGENNSLTIRIFYYIGHSSPHTVNGKTSYYMCLGTKDSHPSGPSKYQELYDYQLNKTLDSGDLKTNNCTLIMLDTCYAGGFINALSRWFGRVILTAVDKDHLARGWIDEGVGGSLKPGYWGWFTGHENANYRNGTNFGPLGIIGGIRTAKDTNYDGWRSAGEVFWGVARDTTKKYADNYPNNNLPDKGKMQPQYDSGVLGSGIPLVMHQPYIVVKWDSKEIWYERYFPRNGAPGRLIIRPRDWGMFRSDSSRTGFSSAFGPGTSPLWIKSLTDPISSSVAIHDGIVFVGTLGGGGGGGGAALYALSWETGEIFWKFTTSSQIYSSPAVKDGAVMFGTSDGRIYALEEYTGMVRWMNYTYGGGGVYSSPAIADGMVFIGSSDGYIQALNATTGWHMWSYFLGGPVDSSPAVADGMVFVGTMGGAALPCLYALNEFTGLPVWSALTDNPVLSTPAVADGIVFVGAMGGAYPPGIYAFNEFSGTPRWSYPMPAPVSSSPAVDSIRGLVIIGCMNGYVYAFNEFTGPPALWSYPTGGPVDRSSPAISSNGYVYVGSADNKIYCLNEITGSKKWDYPTGGPVFASPAITDDHMIIGSSDGNVYNFGPPLPTHDVAVLDLNVSPANVPRGKMLDVTYTVKNKGNVAETFNVEIAYNSTEVWTPPFYNDTIPITTEEVTLAPGATTTKTYHWNTTSIPLGFYSISVEAQMVPNETDTTDNTFLDGVVRVTKAGDFGTIAGGYYDFDDQCDYQDLFLFRKAYTIEYHPLCDFDNNLNVDYLDLFEFRKCYLAP